MPGQFGSLPGAGPGAIWKIDGTTGQVTHLADTAFSGVLNTGPGIGDLAFDPKSKTLYASDLDTGLIHRFDLARNAADLGQFDHGMSGRPGAGLPSLADDGKLADLLSPDFRAEDPAAWGFTQPERRVNALAVNNGRLYYSVASGPEIWSVELAPDGGFGTTARREFAVNAAQPLPITDIDFDGEGRMVLAQRGALKSPFDYRSFAESNGQVLRYAPAPAGSASGDLWVPQPDEYAVGLPDGSRMSAGGVSFTRGYNPDGSIGAVCEQALIATGDDLRNNPALAAQLPQGASTVHGMQVNDVSLVRPTNVPPAQSAFVAFNAGQADPAARGHVGDVEAVPCVVGRGLGEAGLPQGGIPPLADAAPVGPSPSDMPGGAPVGPGGGGVVNPFPGGGGVVDPFPGGGGIVNPFPGGGGVVDPFPGGGGVVNPQDQAGGAGNVDPNQIPSKVNGLEIAKGADAGVTSCTDQGDCVFSITVRNTNATAVTGPIVITETVSNENGGLFGATAISSSPTPPWTCSKQGQTFQCTHPGPIPAGGVSTFKIGFKLGAGAAAKQIKNCALLNGGQVPACATVPLTPPTPLSLLQLKKTADVTQCSDVGGGCNFTISVTNPGPAEFNGVLDINEVVTAGGVVPPLLQISGSALQQAGVTAPISCSKAGDTARCGSGVPAKIPAGKTVDIKVQVKPGGKLNANELKNCAAIKGGNGEVCATIPLKQGPLLRAQKFTAATTCVPQCAFAITVQNIGNAPATGPFSM